MQAVASGALVFPRFCRVLLGDSQKTTLTSTPLIYGTNIGFAVGDEAFPMGYR